MLRQSDRRRGLRFVVVLALFATLAACGIKGPLRHPPKTTPAAAPPPPVEHPATAPATTSPALPPPSTRSEPSP